MTRHAGDAVAVLGLARSGRAALRALLAGGARAVGTDDSPTTRAAAADEGLPVVPPEAIDLAGVVVLVPSPGVPLDGARSHPLVRAAREAGVALLGDLQLLRDARPETPLIGVTGTNGKSTTTALIGHLLAVAGRPAAVAGNIGRPVLDLDPADLASPLVLELSSFQLDLTTRLACQVAVWLNLTPDHLDRHGDMAGYAAAKRRVFAGQGRGDHAVIGVDDGYGEAEASRLDALEDGPRVVRVSGSRVPSGGVGVDDGRLVDRLDGAARVVADLADAPALRGRHNAQNAAAAYAAVRALGLPPDEAVLGLTSFPGLAHRLEPVGRVGGVPCVNDSKATNPTAAATGLSSFESVYWIAGGRAKPGGFAELDPVLPRVRHAFLIGEAAPEIAAYLNERVPSSLCGELGTALDAALALAEAEEAGGSRDAVVLLAPACASFDQFPNFEARGEAFRRLVEARAGRSARAAS